MYKPQPQWTEETQQPGVGKLFWCPDIPFTLVLFFCYCYFYVTIGFIYQGGNPQIFHIKIYLQVLNSNTAHVNIVVQSLLLLKKELSQVWWTSSSDVAWVRAGWLWWLQVWKTKRKKKKMEKSCAVRQLQSCHIVQTIRAAQWEKTCMSTSHLQFRVWNVGKFRGLWYLPLGRMNHGHNYKTSSSK